MRKIIILAAICFLSVTVVKADDFYIAQSAAGTEDGSSCTNADAIADLTWGNGNDVDAGDTLHICGTFTSSLIVGTDGSNGSEITIYFEDDAKFSTSVWSSANGAIKVGSHSYIIIDGGTNGIIENTDNGTALGNQSNTAGIYAPGADNLEIKNLTIRNLYVRTSDSDVTQDSYGSGPGCVIESAGGSDISIHDCTFNNAVCGFRLLGTTASSNITFYNNDFSKIDHNIAIGATNGITNLTIRNNTFSDYYVWDDPSTNRYHHSTLHLYTTGAASDYSGIYIYGNKFFGDPGAYSTGHLYFENPDTDFLNIYIYNNLFLAPDNDSLPCILLGSYSGATSALISNNVFFGRSGNGYGVRMTEDDDDEDIVINNNVFADLESAYSMYSGSANAVGILYDYNLYYNNTYICSNSEDATLNDWQSYVSDDAHSISGAHGLSSEGVPNSESGTVDHGISLSTYYTVDYAGTTRPQGSSWDIGAYEDVPPESPTPVFKIGNGVMLNGKPLVFE